MATVNDSGEHERAVLANDRCRCRGHGYALERNSEQQVCSMRGFLLSGKQMFQWRCSFKIIVTNWSALLMPLQDATCLFIPLVAGGFQIGKRVFHVPLVLISTRPLKISVSISRFQAEKCVPLINYFVPSLL